jgi:arylsulfatase A-like enzyme
MAFRKKGTGILTGNAKMAISPEQFTLADLFQSAGYRTGVIGKWHLGLGTGHIDWNELIEPGPLDLGFDYCFLLPATNDRVPCVYVKNRQVVNLDPDDPITVSYGKPVSRDAPGTAYPDGRTTPEAMTYYPSSHGHNHSVINGIGRIGFMKGGQSALWNDESMTDVFVNEARSFIARHQNEPFFLFYSSQDIHVPRTPHPRFHGKSQLSYRGDAMVQLDWAVGEILTAVQEAGIDDDTLVIFTSDNGPVYDDGYQDGTTVRTSQEEVDRGHDGSGPYRGGKYQIYEGGTRVPLIVRWPAAVKTGISKALISQVDFVASFAAHLSQTIPPNAARDSRNTWDALVGQDDVGSAIILEQARGVAVRKGPWKYFEQAQPGQPKQPILFNLDHDIAEQRNLADDEPEMVAEMKSLLNRFQSQGLAEKSLSPAKAR